MRTVASLVILSFLTAPVVANAALLTADPGTGVTTTFDATGLSETASAIIDGFSVTGSSYVAYGDTSYSLDTNGLWDGYSFISPNSGSDESITINLGGVYKFVGALLNYAPGFESDATIQAIAANGTTVLDSYDLETGAPISTPGGTNVGAFRGIADSTADIAFLRISGDYILMHAIEVGSPVPIPPTAWLFVSGLIGLGAVSRKRSA